MICLAFQESHYRIIPNKRAGHSIKGGGGTLLGLNIFSEIVIEWLALVLGIIWLSLIQGLATLLGGPTLLGLNIF